MKDILLVLIFSVFSLKSYCQSDSTILDLLCNEWKQYKVTGGHSKDENKINPNTIVFNKDGTWDEIENKKVVMRGGWNYSAERKILFMDIYHDHDDGNSGYVHELKLIKLSKKLLIVRPANPSASKIKIYSKPILNLNK